MNVIPITALLFGWIFLRTFPALEDAAQLAFPIVAITAYVVQHRRLKPYAVQPTLVRELDLSPPERLPWFTWLGIPPLLWLAGIALCLRLRWDQLPARFPVYLPLEGTPGEYRTAHWIYGGLLVGGAQAGLLFGIALAVWYGSRRTEAMRKRAMLVVLAWEWVVALALGDIRFSLATGIAIPTLAVQLVPSLLVIAAMVCLCVAFYKPRDPLDPTPSECWKGGILYYNPNDAALFVRRRDAIGFTFNSANRWTWAICGGSLLVVASMFVP